MSLSVTVLHIQTAYMYMYLYCKLWTYDLCGVIVGEITLKGLKKKYAVLLSDADKLREPGRNPKQIKLSNLNQQNYRQDEIQQQPELQQKQSLQADNQAPQQRGYQQQVVQQHPQVQAGQAVQQKVPQQFQGVIQQQQGGHQQQHLQHQQQQYQTVETIEGQQQQQQEQQQPQQYSQQQPQQQQQHQQPQQQDTFGNQAIRQQEQVPVEQNIPLQQQNNPAIDNIHVQSKGQYQREQHQAQPLPVGNRAPDAQNNLENNFGRQSNGQLDVKAVGEGEHDNKTFNTFNGRQLKQYVEQQQEIGFLPWENTEDVKQMVKVNL